MYELKKLLMRIIWWQGSLGTLKMPLLCLISQHPLLMVIYIVLAFLMDIEFSII